MVRTKIYSPQFGHLVLRNGFLGSATWQLGQIADDVSMTISFMKNLYEKIMVKLNGGDRRQ